MSPPSIDGEGGEAARREPPAAAGHGSSFLRVLVLCLLAVLLLASLLYGFTPDALPNGDAALYREQISSLDFRTRTVHVGYYLLGALLTPLLPGSPDRALNAMSCLFGSACLLLLGWIGWHLFGSFASGVAGGLALAANGIFLPNALFAEVYVVQLAFFLAAVLAWISIGRPVRRGLAAGAALGVAALVTPSTLLALPFFLLLPSEVSASAVEALPSAGSPQELDAPAASPSVPVDRARWGEWILLCAVTLAILAAAVLPNRADYFTGRRGALQVFRQAFRPGRALLKEGREVLAGFSFLLPFLVLGLLRLRRAGRGLSFLASLGVLWLCGYAFGERFPDVPVQLPLYALLSAVAGFGLIAAALQVRGGIPRRTDALAAKARTGRSLRSPVFLLQVGLPLVAALLWSGWVAARSARSMRALKAAVEEIGRRGQPGFQVVAHWGEGVLLEHYLWGHAYTGRVIDPARADLVRRAMQDEREIWLIGRLPDLRATLRSHGYGIEVIPSPDPRRTLARGRPVQ